MRKIISIIICFAMLFGLVGCKNRESSLPPKSLNIYVDSKDRYSMDVLKTVVDEYTKEKPDVKVNINYSLGDKIESDIGKDNIDIIVTTRDKLIRLSGKGLLSELSADYEKNKISDRFYPSVNAYGRVGDKYYGIPLVPYTIEIFNNTDNLSKLNITTPKNIKDLLHVVKVLNSHSIKVPVVQNQDITLNEALFSIVFSNSVDIQKLENNYDSGANAYKALKEMQLPFDNLNKIVREGYINSSTFENASDNIVESFNNGTIPILVAFSYNNVDNLGGLASIIDDYTFSSIKVSAPEVVNAILCVPMNNSNSKEIDEFIKFVYDDKNQTKLTKLGYITGSLSANKTLTGFKSIEASHLEKNSEQSRLYVYAIPDKVRSGIASKIEQIIKGNYNGKEWDDIIDGAYK
jgi:raffinose/stachyose/melibiose transport system substrate-binding protein